MNSKPISLNDLKDSKLLYNNDLPKLGYLLIISILLFMSMIIIWSIYTKKPYIVVANGSIRGINKNYIMSEYTGRVYDVSIKEGQEVEAGQILFKVKPNDINMQIKQLQAQKKTYIRTVSDYEKLIKSIKENKNYFSQDKSNNLYYSQYKAYVSKLNQQTIDEDALKGYGYTPEKIADERVKNQAARDQIYYEAINAAATSQKQYQQEIETIDSRIESLKSGAEDFIVRANATGRIHMINELREGMVLQSTSTIASISDTNKETATIIATVSASDRSRIKVGNRASIIVSGLQQNVYGNINGRVEEIDSDISVTENGKSSYFKVKIKPNTTILKSKTGNTIHITNGMAVQARIVYDRISYFDYFMNAIGIKLANY